MDGAPGPMAALGHLFGCFFFCFACFFLLSFLVIIFYCFFLFFLFLVFFCFLFYFVLFIFYAPSEGVYLGPGFIWGGAYLGEGGLIRGLATGGLGRDKKG